MEEVGGGLEVVDLSSSEVLATSVSSAPGDVRGVSETAIAVWEHLDLATQGGERRDVTSLARHPALGRRLLVLDARTEGPDTVAMIARFLAEFASATKELPRYQRTSWLVCVAPPNDDMGAIAFDGVLPHPDVTLAVRWWWGVLGPLDVAVWVDDRVRSRPVEEAVELAVAEVAGPDLALAEELLVRWDGTMSGLDRLVARWTDANPHLAKLPSGGDERAGPRPPAGLLAAWAAGAVESWSGQLRRHVCAEMADDGEAARTRAWLAQVARVFPLIERERTRLAAWVADRRARPAPGWETADLGALEIGELYRWMGAHHWVTFSPKRRALLRWLRDARNDLAHREPLEPASLREGQKRIIDDRRDG
ncbi:MAG: hypothetical protein ACRDZ7_12230 [Acidimicrobiia bacterium]